MAHTIAVKDPESSMQLQPSEELRRPDVHGRLPHIIMTTYPDLPINQLEIDDILEINWEGVNTTIRDAIVRVKHEGDLSSATVRETIQLIALALKKLEIDDAELRRKISRHPAIGFIGWLMVFTPTSAGRENRRIVGIRRETIRCRRELQQFRNAFFELRVELAEELDHKIDEYLMHKNEEYRGLRARMSQFDMVRSVAKNILSEIKQLAAVERYLAETGRDREYSHIRLKLTEEAQLKNKLPSFIAFCERYGDRPILGRSEAELFLRQFISGLDADTAPFEQPMAAMRDAIKRDLYQTR